jgi:site-specific DNA-methyltransferase (adenine-specific)
MTARARRDADASLPPLLAAVSTGAPLVDVIHHTDLLTLCAALPPASVDMVLADLPYGTTACSWDTVIPFEPMWAAFRRVMKPRGAIVLTASQPFTSRLVCSNLEMFKYSWSWVKSIAFDYFNAKNKPMKRHEDVLVFSDGTTANGSPNRMPYYPQDLKRTNRGWHRPQFYGSQHRLDRPSHQLVRDIDTENYPDDVLEFPNGNQGSEHPTQKPVALFSYLIRTYTRPGDLVLDPVVGSGTTALAARNTGRHYICGDSSAEYVAVAKRRLAEPYTLSLPMDVEPAPVATQGALL